MNAADSVNTKTETILQQLYKNHFGSDIKNSQPLTAHGSDRIIIRLHNETGSSCIGIINSHIAENKAFISFAKHFRSAGLNIPEIYNVSDDTSCYLMEDLGDTTLLIELGKNPDKSFSENGTELYKKVINILPEFQINAGKGIDYSLCYQFREFGEKNIDYDVNYFMNNFLSNFYKGKINGALFTDDIEQIKNIILQMRRDFFLYRDFQSRNIMLKDEKMYFIDFQSGRKGPLLYDLASLLYDARAKIPQNERELLIDYYLDVLDNYIKTDKNEMKENFWYFAVIRILQAMGAYGFLGIVKGKSKFLESVPYALENINFILNNRIDNSKLSYLRGIFNELI